MKTFIKFIKESEEPLDWEEYEPQSNQGLLPKMSREEFSRHYNSAKIETRNHLGGVSNTDAEEVVGNPEEMKKRWGQYKQGYEDSYLSNLVKSVESGTTNPPVIVRMGDKEHLLSGNTRAMIHRAHFPNKPIKVKVMDITAHPQSKQ